MYRTIQCLRISQYIAYINRSINRSINGRYIVRRVFVALPMRRRLVCARSNGWSEIARMHFAADVISNPLCLSRRSCNITWKQGTTCVQYIYLRVLCMRDCCVHICIYVYVYTARCFCIMRVSECAGARRSTIPSSSSSSHFTTSHTLF